MLDGAYSLICYGTSANGMVKPGLRGNYGGVGHFAMINRYRPTTKMCSACKNVQDMPLSVRTYTCKECGIEIDRDLNSVTLQNKNL